MGKPTDLFSFFLFFMLLSWDRQLKKKSPSKKPLKGVKSPMPKDIAPMAMTLADEPFNHQDWLYEIKWDGYRAIAFCRGICSEIPIDEELNSW